MEYDQIKNPESSSRGFLISDKILFTSQLVLFRICGEACAPANPKVNKKGFVIHSIILNGLQILKVSPSGLSRTPAVHKSGRAESERAEFLTNLIDHLVNCNRLLLIFQIHFTNFPAGEGFFNLLIGVFTDNNLPFLRC